MKDKQPPRHQSASVIPFPGSCRPTRRGRKKPVRNGLPMLLEDVRHKRAPSARNAPAAPVPDDVARLPDQSAERLVSAKDVDRIGGGRVAHRADIVTQCDSTQVPNRDWRGHGARGTVLRMPNAPADSEQKALIGARLRLVRDALGKNQTELANEFNLSRPNRWVQWESGDRLADTYVMIRFCKQYKVPTDWLYLGDLSMMPSKLADEIRAAMSEEERRRLAG